MNLLIRKRIYSLLYVKPLFDYCDDENGLHVMNVLIIGDGEEAIEAFKAVYWASQMSSAYRGHITMASSDPGGSRDTLDEMMPELFGNGILDTQFDFISPEGVTDVINSCGYVLVCDGGSLPAVKYERTKQLVCFLGEGTLTEDSAAGGREYVNLLKEGLFEEECAELDRLAYNCNYAYCLGENERSAKVSYDEYICSDDEADSEKYYDYLSSLAFPAHIPYILRLCGDFSEEPSEDPIQDLMKCIRDRDGNYYSLLDAEHRRWAAFMIGEGWRMPTDDELYAYAYLNYGLEHGYDQKDRERRLHPCLCRGTANGPTLDKYPGLWQEIYDRRIFTLTEVRKYLTEHYPHEEFCDLEAVSLVLHSIAYLRSREVRNSVDELFSFVDLLPYDSERKVCEELSQSAKKLCYNEPGSVKLFRDCVREATDLVGEGEPSSRLDGIVRSLGIVAERNRRKNFYTIDSSMIDMIPFVLWYGIENKTVITFTEGLAAQDVIVPTQLNAFRAIFIGRGINDEYISSVRGYFEGRHYVDERHVPENERTDTVLEFIRFEKEDQKSISELLEDIVKENSSVAFNCQADNSAAVSLAMGSVAERHDIPVYTCSKERGTQNLRSGELIAPGLARKSFSMQEYIGLMGGEYTNVYEKAPYLYQMRELEKLFREYSPIVRCKDRKGDWQMYSIWASLSNLFQSFGKKNELKLDRKRSERHMVLIFDGDIYEQCGIGEVLEGLSSCRIIKSLSVERGELGLVKAVFTDYDTRLGEILEGFDHDHTTDPETRQRCLKTVLSLNVNNNKMLSEVRMYAEDVVFCFPGENLQLQERKRQFVGDLEKSGILSDVVFSPDGYGVSFTVNDLSVLETLRNQGDLFEQILYNKFRHSGLCDDVQTGVSVTWNPSDTKDVPELMDLVRKDSRYGLEHFLEVRQKHRNMFSDAEGTAVPANEVDVMIMNHMVPTFISCKTEVPTSSRVNSWLYEIATVANHFHANAVLALMQDMDKTANALTLSRARQMGVSVIGTETIFDEKRMLRAIGKLSKGMMVYGNETGE